MDFLGIAGKTFLVMGVANRKSVAWFIARQLQEAGAKVIFSVRSEQRRESVRKLIGDAPCLVCDVEESDAADKLVQQVRELTDSLDGFLHSVAYANYASGVQPFHETRREDFLQAMTISAFSLVEISKALKPLFTPDASVVTIGISDDRVAAESYGYMAPVKSALETSLTFLAKSFSHDSRVRFNAVNAGPLKTSASAGIPGYLDNYLYAEALTFRGKGVTTEETASTAVFLLSPRSSGINATTIKVDAGMGSNFFDRKIVDAFHGKTS